MFLHVAVGHSILLLSSIPLSGYMTTSLPRDWFMNILVVSSLGQLKIMLL